MAKKKTRISNVTHTPKKSRDLAKKDRLKKKRSSRKQPLEYNRNQSPKKNVSKPVQRKPQTKKSKKSKIVSPKQKKTGSWRKLTSERQLEKLQQQYFEREKSLRKREHALEKQAAKIQRQGERYEKNLKEFHAKMREERLQSYPVFVTKKVLRWFKKHRNMTPREVYTLINSPPNDGGVGIAA